MIEQAKLDSHASVKRCFQNCPTAANYLHVINHPDLPGEACDVQQHSIELPTYNLFSLPNFPNYRLGPLAGSPCDTIYTVDHISEQPGSILTISPNPAADQVLLSLSNNSISKPFTWEAYMASGQKVASGNGTNNERVLNVSAWPNGLYLFKVLLPGGGVVMEKVVIQH